MDRYFARPLISTPKNTLREKIIRQFDEASALFRVDGYQIVEAIGVITFSWRRDYQIVDKVPRPRRCVVSVSYSRFWPFSAWNLDVTAELQLEEDGVMKTIATSGNKPKISVWQWDEGVALVLGDQFREAIGWAERTARNGKT